MLTPSFFPSLGRYDVASRTDRRVARPVRSGLAGLREQQDAAASGSDGNCRVNMPNVARSMLTRRQVVWQV